MYTLIRKTLGWFIWQEHKWEEENCHTELFVWEQQTFTAPWFPDGSTNCQGDVTVNANCLNWLIMADYKEWCCIWSCGVLLLWLLHALFLGISFQADVLSSEHNDSAVRQDREHKKAALYEPSTSVFQPAARKTYCCEILGRRRCLKIEELEE